MKVAARPRLTTAVLAVTDVVSLLLSALLAALVTAPLYGAPFIADLRSPAALILLAPLALMWVGVYPGAGLTAIAEFRRSARAVAAVGIAGMLVMPYVTDVATPWPLLFATLLAIFSVPFGRSVVREFFARRAWWGEPVVIIGAGATAQLLIERLRQYPRAGLKPVACLDDDPAKIGTWIEGVHVVGGVADSDRFVRDGIHTAVIAMPGVAPDSLVDLVGRHTKNFHNILLVPNLFGMKTLGVETCDLGGVLGLRVRHNLIDPLNQFVKRVLDLVMSLPAIVFGLPLVLLSAALIYLVSPGNPFYYQVRIGKDGREIRVWKLRTMYLDAGERLERLLAHDPVAKREWAQNFKLDRDPRILPIVGTFLRKTSIDELPQVVNVLMGEMSLVGPRPFPEYHLDVFDDAFRALRSEVRPGITGLWQVSVRSDGDVNVQRELDTYYIRNWSVWMDLYVLARTPLVVLMARGAK